MVKIPRDIKIYFLVLLGIFYFILGVYIYISRKQITSSPWGELLAALFIVYGGWRIYRALQTKTHHDVETEN